MALPTFQASNIIGPISRGSWEIHDLPAGSPVLSSGRTMRFYVLKPPGWDPSKFCYTTLVWEHEDGEGNRAYQGDDSLPSASQADQWFNNADFQGSYPFLILLPAADQTGGSSTVFNFGGWTPPNDDKNEDSVALCAQWAIANLGADPNGMIVGGASLGGIGTWALALDHAKANGARSKTFTGFIPMAGVIERNGFGVGPTAAQFAIIAGSPIFAVHGAGDTTSQPNWDLAVWKNFAGNAPTVSGPAGAQAGTSLFRLLFDPNLGHDVWDTYVPLPKGKPIWDWAWTQGRSSGVQPVPTPAPTPITSIPPSPNNTVVLAGSSAAIIDGFGNAWTITAGGQIAKNSLVDATTKNVTQLAYVNGVIEQENTAGNWYSWTGGGWSPPSITSPLPPGPTPAPTPGPTSPPTGTNPTPAGFFKVSNGKIIRPDGSVFIGGGFNFNQPDQFGAVMANGLIWFPGTRIVRMANRTYADPSTYAALFAWVQQNQILLIAEDHTGISAQPYTGAALAAETGWYGKMAAYYKNNPWIAFGTFNEPGQGTNLPAIATQERAIYDAIRATGSHALVFFEPPSGGIPGMVGSNGKGYDGSGPMTLSLYADVYNGCWDLHFYNWVTKYSTDVATIVAALQGSVTSASGVAGAQSITSADGIMPVVIGEFGNSTTGGAVDPGGAQLVNIVGTSGLSFCAWAWDPDEQGDQMVTDSGSITPYGSQVAELIKNIAAANPIVPVPTPNPTPAPTQPPVTPPPTPVPTQPPSGVTVASVQAEIDAITTALAKVRSDIALLP